MNLQDLVLLRVWVEGNHSALEWKVGDRTFQILGIKGAEGGYERFFDRGKHPMRQRISEQEVMKALENAISPLELYQNEKGSGEFFPNAETALDAAKRWVGQRV
ncbi:MAG: hypothetical protein V4467_03085 [Patescibacteria group bacterium]